MLERNVGLPDYRERNNPSATIILVDQDNVLADFEGQFLRKWREIYPDLPYISLEQRKSSYIYQDYPDKLLEQVESIYNSPGFVAQLPPIDGALEALREMKQEGYVVKICTAQIPGNRNSLTEKYDWVIRYLGKDWAKDLVVSNDKTIIFGQILIDDKPIITGTHKPSWEHIIFDAPYNRSTIRKRRLRGWGNWHGVLVSNL